jgi:hypothetical protein
MCKTMLWFISSVFPSKNARIDKFPFYVGRNEDHSSNGMVIQNATVSREQFVLESRLRGLYYKNLSKNSPAELDGVIVVGERKLEAGKPHIVHMGDVTVVLGSDSNVVSQMAAQIASECYIVNYNGEEYGPMKEDELLDYCENGTFKPSTKVWCVANPGKVMEMAELIDFSSEEAETAVLASVGEKKRSVAAEEAQAELGESFMCPYCRTVSDLADVLSVSTSPALLGDPVLGEGEQRRFLPSQFTSNGLALDSEGGVCTEIA